MKGSGVDDNIRLQLAYDTTAILVSHLDLPMSQTDYLVPQSKSLHKV
jgi:hypothetical protein